MRLRGGAAAAASVVVLLGTLAGCKDTTTASDGPSGTSGPGGGGGALAAVDSLTVKGRAPKTGYERSRFGTAWADTDSNSCDTRVISVLRRATEACAQLMPGVMSCAY